MSDDRKRFLLTRDEAVESLGMSLPHFKRHVQPHMPCVYIGRRRYYRPADIKRWVDREISRAA